MIFLNDVVFVIADRVETTVETVPARHGRWGIEMADTKQRRTVSAPADKLLALGGRRRQL